MSKPNTAYAYRERDDDSAPAENAAGVEAAPSPPPSGVEQPAPPVLPPGVELLIGQISEALADGQIACTMLQRAKASRDKQEIASAAHALFVSLGSDPKALARKVAVMVKHDR